MKKGKPSTTRKIQKAVKKFNPDKFISKTTTVTLIFDTFKFSFEICTLQ